MNGASEVTLIDIIKENSNNEDTISELISPHTFKAIEKCEQEE